MAEKTYEEIVSECAETRRDLDVVLHPQFNALKKAFKIFFERHGFIGSDFKRLSDLVYYQGGYPSPTTPAKEQVLADQVASALKLEDAIGREVLRKLLAERGIKIEFIEWIGSDVTLSDDETKELADASGEAGIDNLSTTNAHEALKTLVDKAQKLQATICQTADTIKVEAAAVVEEKFKIKKSNFVKAVNLAAVRLKRSQGVMEEKVDQLEENLENLQDAIEPLKKKG